MADIPDKDFKTNLKMLKELKEDVEKVKKMMHQQNGNINKYASWKSQSDKTKGQKEHLKKQRLKLPKSDEEYEYDKRHQYKNLKGSMNLK